MTSARSPEEAYPNLDEMLESLRELPNVPSDQPRALFGHIHIPAYRSQQSILDKVCLSVPVDRKKTRLFLIGGDEPSPDGDNLSEGELAPVRMTMAYLLRVLRANLRPPGCIRRPWRSTPRAWVDNFILPRDAVFLLQLDLNVSAECALALTLMVEWALSISRDEYFTNIRVLTLSSQADVNFLPQLLRMKDCALSVLNFDLSSRQDPMAANAVSDAHSPELIAQELASVIRRRDGPTRLIISFDSSIQGHLVDALDDDELDRLDPCTILSENFECIADLLMVEPFATAGRTTLVTIFGQVPVRPEPTKIFDEVHVVFGLSDASTPAWDDEACQVLTYPRPTSSQCRQRQQWWAYHPDTPVTVYSSQDTEEFMTEGTDSVRLVEGSHLGAFVASTLDLERYGMSSESIINCFVRCPRAVKETKHMMTTQGLVSNNSLALSDLEVKSFLNVLHLVRYDYRLAMFLALDSSPTVRLVKAQFAAVVITRRPLYRLTLTNGVHTRAAAIETVFNCFHGYGRSLARQGSTWLRLGLAKYSIFRRARRITLMQGPLDGIVDISEFTSDKIRVSVADILEELAALRIDIPYNVDTPRERKEMTGDEQYQIHCHLFKSYMYQITLCQNQSAGSQEQDGNPAIKLLRSMTPCNLTTEIATELLDIKSLVEASGDKIAYGISHLLTRSPTSNVVMNDWVMIPSGIIASWENETGVSLQTVLPSKAQ
ncbi:hypothetical protein HYE68_009053 [Fusarium pseudograminearum]|nr:hypothetical protein HYE68_009053 [Fusarium pseudograminearum]